jgi:hypothetical protein
MLAADQPGQVAPLLFLGAVTADLVDAQIGMRAIGKAHRSRGAGDLLHRHDMLKVAHAGAAIVRLHGDAQHTQIAELAPQLHRERVVSIDRRGARRDLVGGERLDAAAQHVGRFAEVEVQARKPV